MFKKGVKVKCVKCLKKHFVPTTVVTKKEKFRFDCKRCGQKNAVNVEVVRLRINPEDTYIRDEESPSDKLGS